MNTNVTTNLVVESVVKAVAVYEGVLGFSVIASAPGQNEGLQFAILSKDKLMLMLQEKGNLIEEYPVLNTDVVHPSVTLYIMVDNFDSLYAEIKGKHPIYTEIHESFYGAKEFAITDADGYVLTFTESKEN